MTARIAYLYFLGLPLIGWIGILSLLLLISTAVYPWLKTKGWIKLSFVWHMRLAKLTVTVAIIHAILALGVYL